MQEMSIKLFVWWRSHGHYSGSMQSERGALKPWASCLLAKWHWSNYFTSVSFNIILFKIGFMMAFVRKCKWSLEKSLWHNSSPALTWCFSIVSTGSHIPPRSKTHVLDSLVNLWIGGHILSCLLFLTMTLSLCRDMTWPSLFMNWYGLYS